MKESVWYRYEEIHWSGGLLTIALRVCPVTKETPKGVWIDYYGIQKWVSNHTRKRFAYPTESDARKAFIFRKKRQIVILSSRLSGAKKALAMAVAGQFDDQDRHELGEFKL